MILNIDGSISLFFCGRIYTLLVIDLWTYVQGPSQQCYYPRRKIFLTICMRSSTRARWLGEHVPSTILHISLCMSIIVCSGLRSIHERLTRATPDPDFRTLVPHDASDPWPEGASLSNGFVVISNLAHHRPSSNNWITLSTFDSRQSSLEYYIYGANLCDRRLCSLDTHAISSIYQRSICAVCRMANLSLRLIRS